MTRAEIKRRAFEEIFFGKIKERKTKITRLFANTFPEMWDIVCQIKAKDYRLLSHVLQRVESGLIIHRICKRLMNMDRQLFIATIHDSLLVKKQKT